MEKQDYKNSRLFHYVSPICSYITDEVEQGELIGYSIVKSLKSFNTRRKNKHRIRILELEDIYKGLDEILKEVKSTNNPYEILFNVQQEVTPYLKEAINKEEFKIKSPLLKEIVKFLTIRTDNKEDLVKRAGIGLTQDVKRGGRTSEDQSCIMKDYDWITHHFTRKKGERR